MDKRTAHAIALEIVANLAYKEALSPSELISEHAETDTDQDKIAFEVYGIYNELAERAMKIRERMTESSESYDSN